MPTALYSQADVECHVDLADALETVTRTYVETARGKVLNPSKLTMHLGDDGEWPDRNAFSIDMPAYVDWLDVAGMKWAVATWDADVDTPVSAQILLFDLDSGEFTSVMEGMYITGVRTALQSVIGLQSLSPTRPVSIGLFGAGFQAGFQISVIDALLDVELFTVYDAVPERARALTADLQPETDAEVVVAERPEGVVGGDAVVTATDSKTPVVPEHSLDAVPLVIALGSYRELPDETVLGADHLIVDHVDQCLQRGALADLASRGAVTAGDVDATIGAVLDDQYSAHIGPDDRVVFVPIGQGSLDVAIAEQVHRAAMGTAPDTDGDAIAEFSFV